MTNFTTNGQKQKLNEIDNFTEDGSGWVFISIVQLKIHTVKDEPMGGSSYIPLSKYLAKKEAIVSRSDRLQKLQEDTQRLYPIEKASDLSRLLSNTKLKE